MPVFRLSGEYKDKDRISGRDIAGSEDKRVFFGPKFALTWGQYLLNLNFDFPLRTDSSAQEVTPRYRLLARLQYLFN